MSGAQPQITDEDFRQFLQQELLERCRKNPQYSVRAFARLLRVDPSNLAKILRGDRKLGARTVQKLSLRLGLTPDRAAAFVDGGRRARKQARKVRLGFAEPTGPAYGNLALDTFEIIADWQHYAILELMRLDHFEGDVRWIARTMEIPVAQARIAVERLQRVEILEITSDGRWIDRSDGRSTTTGNPFSAVAFRKMQRQILEGAISALEETPMEERDQSSMTMAVDADKLGEARDLIKQFRRQMAQLLSRGECRNEVYQLSVSLYPVTRLKRAATGKSKKNASTLKSPEVTV